MKSGKKTPIQPLVPESNRVSIWVMPGVKASIIFFDIALAFLCFWFAFYLRGIGPAFSFEAFSWSQEFAPYLGVLLFLITARTLFLAYEGVYRMHGAFSYVNEFIKVFKAILIGTLATIAFTFLFRGGFEYRDFSYSRGIFLIDFALALIVFSIFHLGLRYIQTIFRKNDINLIPTLIVGINAEAAQTIKALRNQPELGYRIVGLINTDDSAEVITLKNEFSGINIVGNLQDLADIIQVLSIQEVIITDSKIPNETLFETMMQSGRGRKVEFRMVPSMFSFLPQKTNVEQIGILPMIRLFREPISYAEGFVKRGSDIIISLLSIALVSPVWLIVCVLIKLDSPGSILFKQERVGMDGRKFLCLKFRTMKENADQNLHLKAFKENIRQTRIPDQENGDVQVYGKVRNDPRITKIGRILRRLSLDETPQLLNVLKGDMSIVGPRPPIPYEVEEYLIEHRRRLDMKPGLTGLWQVSGRNRLTFEKMVDLDLYYIENWSIWLDIRIILLTMPAILRGEGEQN